MSATPNAKDRASRTQERLAALQKQLSKTPRRQRIQGKVCIVTGAASLRGIGRASALLFAHEGAKAIVLVDYQLEGIQDLEKVISKQYPEVKLKVIQADVGDEPAIESLCKTTFEEFGSLDVFFANAGRATGLPMAHVSGEDFSSVHRVNTLSCFLAIKHASHYMTQNASGDGGSIILTASVAGLRSGAGSIDYSASKAGVISLASVGASHLTGTNIRVNAVLPGLIETGMTEVTFDAARKRGSIGKVGQLNPLQRYGIAEEIANAVLFLASDESSYVNGASIPVDGGLSASLPIVPGKIH